MDSSSAARPSRAHNPDLDWSQVRETVQMLNVAIAQIETALRSGDESVTTLANSFTSMVSNTEIIAAAARNLPESPEASTILDNCKSVSGKMHAAIVAFQFYDKLSQRLTHLTNSLGDLNELVSQPDQLYSPGAWRGLQEKIKSKYTVEADKAMFEAILAGKSVQEAIQTSRQSDAAAQDDDIELF